MAQGSHDNLLETLYAAPMQPVLWEPFLMGLCETIGLRKAALITHDFASDSHAIFASVDDETRESIASYEDHYYKFDEWTLRFAKRIPMGKFVLGETVWPRDLMVKSVFFNDFLKPFDTHQMACTVIAGSSNVFDGLSIYRGARDGTIGSEQLEVLNGYIPHLRTALSLRGRLSDLERKATDLERALDQLTVALILLNFKGKPIFISRAARILLDAKDGLLLRAHGLQSQKLSEHRSLCSLISSVIDSTNQKRDPTSGSVSISRSLKRPLRLLVAPFPLDVPHAPRGAAAIVSIADPEATVHLPSDILHEFYGLTQAETRLARLLLDGNSLIEAAEMIGVTRETVRSQVKSIFHKTGMRGQGQLMRFLIQLGDRYI